MIHRTSSLPTTIVNHIKFRRFHVTSYQAKNSVEQPIIQNPKNFIITHRGVVYPKECDHMGHLNVMYYTNKFDIATWQLFDFLDLPYSYFKDGKHGVAAMEMKTSFKKEVFPGETYYVRSGIFSISGKVIKFHHEMLKRDEKTNEEIIAATCSITGAHFDRQIHKAVPFPSFVIEKAKLYTIA